MSLHLLAENDDDEGLDDDDVNMPCHNGGYCLPAESGFAPECSVRMRMLVRAPISFAYACCAVIESVPQGSDRPVLRCSARQYFAGSK